MQIALKVKLSERGTAGAGYRSVRAMATRPMNASAQAKSLHCCDE